MLVAYNPLIPDGGNWKATFMAECPDAEERRAVLGRLVGIEDQIWVRVAGWKRAFAIADEDLERTDETKTSSVHFLRFELSPELVVALKDDAGLAAGIDHPNYRQETAVGDAVCTSLIRDLD